MTARPTVLLLGESPPRGAPPDFNPFDCASGTILAGWLGLTGKAVLLAHTDRDNCFHTPTGIGGDTPEWDADAAAVNAHKAVSKRVPRLRTVVALGRRASNALGMDPAMPALTWHHGGDGIDIMHVPHPSGRSTSLNTEAKRADARRCLLSELVLGCPTLRPWHFRLDEPAILADLGAALAPHHPALGAAMCVLAGRVKAHHDRMTLPQQDLGAPPTAARKALADLAAGSMRLVDVSLSGLAQIVALGTSNVSEWLTDVVPGREVRTLVKTCEKMPEVRDYPSAVLRAIYGRHVALGIGAGGDA